MVLLVGSATAVVAQPRGNNRRSPTAADAGASMDASADASAPADAAPSDGGVDATTSDVTWPMRQLGQGTLIHFPVPEQLARTGVPVFAQVRSSAPIDHVSVFYRGVGARRFTELRMQPMGQQFRMPNGYGALIPCDDIFPPRIEYYIQSIDSSGAPNGSAGTDIRPVQVAIVERRSHPAPVLPGQAPPVTCGAMTGPSAGRDAGRPATPTRGTADLGEPCQTNNDCRNGLRCGTTHSCVFESRN
ncbi:MAG: hypothetical protein R3A48_02645 [Polyangiales bacterium]